MRLKLETSDKEGVLVGQKSDGTKYSVRQDRRRYFFPSEWNSFISQIKNKKHRFFFITSLMTGGRIMEILNLQHKDIDIERGLINFSVVKQRKAKKNFHATGKTRNFFVSSNFIKEYKSFIRGREQNPDGYLFLDDAKLPPDYSQLSNDQRKKYYISKRVSYTNMLKRYLKKAQVKDWYNFSPHNLRKTYGMWMRSLGIDGEELCYRLGHDMDTYILHYGSSLIFTEAERREIAKIIGDIK